MQRVNASHGTSWSPVRPCAYWHSERHLHFWPPIGHSPGNWVLIACHLQHHNKRPVLYTHIPASSHTCPLPPLQCDTPSNVLRSILFRSSCFLHVCSSCHLHVCSFCLLRVQLYLFESPLQCVPYPLRPIRSPLYAFHSAAFTTRCELRQCAVCLVLTFGSKMALQRLRN
jgi:hypothetical protein